MMRYFLIVTIYILAMNSCKNNQINLPEKSSSSDSSNWILPNTDSLPIVLINNHSDLIGAKLRFDAMRCFTVNQLPDNLKDWEERRIQLKNQILEKTGVIIDHDLELNIKETGTIQMNGYSIKKITFQTRPDIYATANLFIPEGIGPFPAVIFMIGHWPKGKIDTEGPQAVGHTLAANGYVCLSIDPWGSGERTTIHGIFEDHGDANNLGSSLMNIGESIMGIEISDNIRGVDLLCSLPYVDSKKIGATGASGGGNQTMWLSAMDERIKAAMPVVSVGTFESYIMGTPCICEVLADAFSITEEAGILALIAPRALKICNHNLDDNQAFFPSEMIRSYSNAKPIFKMYGVENNLTYQLFDLTHGYLAEDREALLGWFDLHLKGIGNGLSRKEIPFELLSEDKLMVFHTGQRDANVIGTVEYCKKRGKELKNNFLKNGYLDIELKRSELIKLLGLHEKSDLIKVNEYTRIKGWNRFALETSDNKLIPVIIYKSPKNSKEFVVLTNPEGKNKISAALIREILESGKSVAIADLSGTGEASSIFENDYTTGRLRTVSRSQLWFGRTMIGEWVKEYKVIADFLESRYQAERIGIDGNKETGLAGLFLIAIDKHFDKATLRNAPVTYLFDQPDSVDYFSMAIHLPAIINWGDLSLAAALSGKDVFFINPLSLSGRAIEGNELAEIKEEYKKVRAKLHKAGTTVFK